jgi:hypothetical protein
VPAAIAAFNQQLGFMFRAVPRTTETDYVAFSLESEVNACFSSLGRIGGRQVIGGIPSCSTGALLHEIGHAIGLYHEQTRDDFGTWVSVDEDAVDPGFANNYRGSLNQRDLGIYDLRLDHALRLDQLLQDGPGSSRAFLPAFPSARAPGIRAGHRRAAPLYGLFDATWWWIHFRTGLSIVVDGASRVAPAEFSWPLGSTHTIEVPASAQVLDGVVHTFARWSSDSGRHAGDAAGDHGEPRPGTLTEPRPTRGHRLQRRTSSA